MPLSTDEVLELMQSVAAEVITPRFRSLSASQIDEKRPGDLVTVADHEAEELLTKALLEAYPDAVVLGEEAYATAPELIEQFRAADHGFTVDPVDGTKNFVNGSKDHAVMIAEVIDGETVRGWIWQPEHEMAWVAEHGGGVRRNGELVRREPAGDQPQGATSIWSRRGRQPVGLPKLHRHLGLLRGRLPEADRGRGRLRALRPHQPVGPPARHADGARGGRGGLAPRRHPLHRTVGRRRAGRRRRPGHPGRAPARPAPTSGRADAARTPTNLDVSGGFGFNAVRVTSRVTAANSRERVIRRQGRGAREPPGPQHIERTLRDPHFVDP